MHTLQLKIDDSIFDKVMFFLENISSNDIEILSDKKTNNDEQADIENMLNNRTSEDKEVAFSKIIEIDV